MMSHSKGRPERAWTMGVLASLTAFGAIAKAPPTPTQAPIVQGVIDCRKVEDASQRLACYDKAVDGMAQAQAKGDLVTMDRQQRQAVRHQAFGLNLPLLSVFDRGEKGQDADRITATLASATKNGDGFWIFRLDDGAVWRQTDDTVLTPTPAPGVKVTIRKGMMGSFFIQVEGHQEFRAHRDN